MKLLIPASCLLLLTACFSYEEKLIKYENDVKNAQNIQIKNNDGVLRTSFDKWLTENEIRGNTLYKMYENDYLVYVYDGSNQNHLNIARELKEYYEDPNSFPLYKVRINKMREKGTLKFLGAERSPLILRIKRPNNGSPIETLRMSGEKINLNRLPKKVDNTIVK